MIDYGRELVRDVTIEAESARVAGFIGGRD